MGLLLPENEAARLDALRSYRILDTAPEQAFDDLARLTAYLCGTPIAFIGLIDADRVWFKSLVGWDVSEIPRDMSFCAQAILQAEPLIVSDTLADHGRLAGCLLASHGGIRFYAGVPLVSTQGYVLGTLSAMDSVPRGLTMGQTEALVRLAHQVVTLIESRARTPEPSLNLNPVPAQLGLNDQNTEPEPSRAALPPAERRLANVIDSAMDAIITVNSEEQIVVFNRAAEQIFRCTAAEALGQPIDRFIPERFRAAHHQHIHNFAATGVTARSMHAPASLFAVRADGEEFPIEATISQVEFEGEKLFTVILRDIGARLAMEADLRQAQKMEAVGQLAGGVAHAFNNFLGIILGYSELLSQEAIGNERLERCVVEIKAATSHAASLTRQLLNFGRKQALEVRVLDLNRCVWEAHNLLRRLMPANVEVVPVLGARLGRVKADEGQIKEALVNLLINARDAMPLGGKVLIETADFEVDQEYAGRHAGLHPGGYVLLSITDTGCGMNRESRSHLFEPFYTTKEPGKGTGLGLSTVYGIVTHNGGYISVESAVGEGTTFRIYLPRFDQPIDELDTAGLPIPSPRETGAILVVEDEVALRRLICICLEKRKHTVLTAKDGAEAVEIFRQNPDQIRLVLTDLMMPRMDGLELRREIAALKPEQKFLFMSGYAESMLQQHRELLAGCAFLEKPFLPEELANMVSSLLAEEAAA